MGGLPFCLGVLPIAGMGGLPFCLGVLPIAGIREDAFCLLGLIASKRVRPEICPPFVRVLPVIITRRLPFTFFVSQVVLLILHPFLADVTHTEHA